MEGLFGLIGVVIGALITTGFEVWKEGNARQRRYRNARASCIKRLKHIQAAVAKRGEPERVDASEVISNELTYLGPDFDRYLQAAADAGISSDEALERPLREVLILHDVKRLDEMIQNLEAKHG